MNLFIKTRLHKCARCMTLSVLETSLPMQRSHYTLSFQHFCPKLVSWSLTAQVVTRPWKHDWGPSRSKYAVSTLGCEPSGSPWLQATHVISGNFAFWPLCHERQLHPWLPCPQELHPISVKPPCSPSPWRHKWISLSRHVYTCVQGTWQCLFWRPVCQCREVMTPLASGISTKNWCFGA